MMSATLSKNGPQRAVAAIGMLLIGATDAGAAQVATADAAQPWQIAKSRDDRGCFATRRYDGPGETTLLLGLDADGSNHLTVLNDNWSITPKQVLALDFRLSRGGYGGHRAIGIEADGKKGFVATFERRFPEYFAASQRLDIARDKTPVARLDLTGSGAAVAELRRCVAARAPARAQATPPADVPIDPFAEQPDRPKNR